MYLQILYLDFFNRYVFLRIDFAENIAYIVRAVYPFEPSTDIVETEFKMDRDRFGICRNCSRKVGRYQKDDQKS